MGTIFSMCDLVHSYIRYAFIYGNMYDVRTVNMYISERGTLV